MLKVTTTGNGIELTDAILAAVDKKVGSLDRYLVRYGTPQEARVELSKTSEHHKKGQVYRVEINLHLPIDVSVIRAEATSFKLYDALDLAKDEIKREISKASGMRESAARRGARKAKEDGTESDLVH